MMVDGEVDCRWTGQAHSYYRRSLETDGVEQGGEISIIDVSPEGVPGITLRCTCASRVEPQGSAEGVQPPADREEPGVVRQKIGGRCPVKEHQVQRPVPAHLVG
jgi:hypothetical protein